MRILFCNIAWMKYYKGICENDKPFINDSYLEKAGMAGEIHCFNPIFLLDEESDSSKGYCMGAVEAALSSKGRNELNLELLEGIERGEEKEHVNNVLIVWCAKDEQGETSIIGWYKNATVYREYQELLHTSEDGTEAYRLYNISATVDNCTLLPTSNRIKNFWIIPKEDHTAEFFDSRNGNVWYPRVAREDGEQNQLVSRIVEQINNYNEENWVDRFPNQL